VITWKLFSLTITNYAQISLTFLCLWEHCLSNFFLTVVATWDSPGSPTSSKCDSPLTRVPDGSTRCTPPIRTKATASLTAYSPYTWGQKLERMWFLAWRGVSVYFCQKSANSCFSSSVTTTPALCSLLTDRWFALSTTSRSQRLWTV